MTVVIGTAGHIDHGKTTLLRALTGIDADRLPEEQRRGMTIDVGYAHLTLPDGTELDFVDVPGHDRLVGNMLVGAGEIDAAMLVVAADDGPRAQTIEHLALLDALGIRHGLAVVTKADVAGPERTAEVVAAVERLLEGTTLAGSPVLGGLVGRWRRGRRRSARRSCDFAIGCSSRAAASRIGPAGLAPRDRPRLLGQGPRRRRDRDAARAAAAFAARPSGSCRATGPSASARSRSTAQPSRSAGPGRTALNLAGVEVGDLHRGAVLTDDPAVVVERPDPRPARRAAAGPRAAPRPPRHRGDGREHRSQRPRRARASRRAPAAIVRLAAPLAVAPGDRLVLRRTSGADRIVGAMVLDVAPPRGDLPPAPDRRTGRAPRRRRSQAARRRGASPTPASTSTGCSNPPDGAAAPVRIAPDVVESVDATIAVAVAMPPTASRR